MRLPRRLFSQCALKLCTTLILTLSLAMSTSAEDTLTFEENEGTIIYINPPPDDLVFEDWEDPNSAAYLCRQCRYFNNCPSFEKLTKDEVMMVCGVGDAGEEAFIGPAPAHAIPYIPVEGSCAKLRKLASDPSVTLLLHARSVARSSLSNDEQCNLVLQNIESAKKK
ncbi:MAG: hypothetical protein AAF940_04900 [Pseudomonadota bacterium]